MTSDRIAAANRVQAKMERLTGQPMARFDQHGVAVEPTITADLDDCPHCEGQGAYWDDQTGQPDEPQGGRFVKCHVCRGEGYVDTSPCIACGAPKYDHDEGCPLGEEVQR